MFHQDYAINFVVMDVVTETSRVARVFPFQEISWRAFCFFRIAKKTKQKTKKTRKYKNHLSITEGKRCKHFKHFYWNRDLKKFRLWVLSQLNYQSHTRAVVCWLALYMWTLYLAQVYYACLCFWPTTQRLYACWNFVNVRCVYIA